MELQFYLFYFTRIFIAQLKELVDIHLTLIVPYMIIGDKLELESKTQLTDLSESKLARQM